MGLAIQILAVAALPVSLGPWKRFVDRNKEDLAGFHETLRNRHPVSQRDLIQLRRPELPAEEEYRVVLPHRHIKHLFEELARPLLIRIGPEKFSHVAGSVLRTLAGSAAAAFLVVRFFFAVLTWAVFFDVSSGRGVDSTYCCAPYGITHWSW